MKADKLLLRVVACSLLTGPLILPAIAAGEDSSPATASVKPAFGTIAGKVVSQDGRPASNVMVTAARTDGAGMRSAISDRDGAYTLADVVPASYLVTTDSDIENPGQSTPIVVAAGHAVRFDITLRPTLTSTRPAGDKSRSLWRLNTGPSGSLDNQLRAQAEGRTEKSTATVATPAEPATVASLGTAPIAAALDKPAASQTAPEAAPAAPVPAKPTPVLPDPLSAPEPPPPGVDNVTPFAFGDFSWLNGNPRNNPVLDTKFFTPEIRFDTYFLEDFNQPVDHSMGGSTEQFRSGEFQLEQISVGGDFHWENVRGRVLYMNGLFASTTPRNDASAGVGQWNLNTAYRYVSEAWGGYHWDGRKGHGFNIDAGIFVSYIGLFSYYNFDNWTYQPSFVSSNTPWFFNGLRIQYFFNNKLKIEPWIVNGWQSYAKYNGHRGIGGQILYMPTEKLKFVFNNYGNGTDDLGVPGRSRIHTDDSVEYRYYSKPGSTGISKAAFSLTGDAGCEYGSGVTCHGGKGGPKQSFLGTMFYDRYWFDKDLFAVTIGGGVMNNPGRYLTLLPPINGATAVTGSPYFTENPGDKAKMYDATLNFQWMPKSYITWWLEAGYRHSNVPYWTGRGGITPPGGNTANPADYVCAAGGDAGSGTLAQAEVNCGGGLKSIWFPDLREGQASVSGGVMVKF